MDLCNRIYKLDFLWFVKRFLTNSIISDMDEMRIAAMDKQGVDMQVISYGNNTLSKVCLSVT